MIRKSYRDGRWGQIHLRENSAVAGPPLLCLHATAYSSRSFEPLLQALDGTRHAMAVDTPGYGESAAPPARSTIGDYAETISAILPATADIFGYHTGVSIAVEIALRYPQHVNQLILMGIPHFRALDYELWRKKLSARHVLSDSLGQFAERWDFLVSKRPDPLSLADGFANFVDELKAWPAGWWAHEALFSHDLPARLSEVSQPIIILNPKGHLAAPSRAAAALVKNAQLFEFPDVTGAALLHDPVPLTDLLASASTPGAAF